jgi:enterochelin esterase-like enzyme
MSRHPSRLWLSVALIGSAIASPGLATAQPLRGTVQTSSFTGPVTQRQVNYTLYLPQGYSTSTRRYPVVYMLHGIGGSHTGPFNTSIPQSFESALDQCRIGPVIVVFPNGYVDNF